ncbi:uncharacterized protein MEPE_04174 [Melanopsichium pennsylvanicum]|uniref:Uncharacterized protein n=2 Tax=Melanopsichium pennsylvanicum TaxID=63383 RepID=A0AAJ4XNE1_9BASI
MAAVASAPNSALAASFSASSPTSASAPPVLTNNDHTVHLPPRLLLRLSPQPEIDSRRNPLKRKWRSIINFFALPIRAYYLEPPGVAYRAELRARRRQDSNEVDDHNTFWSVPAYTDQVGDDEMVLFKAQEEAEALAAMHRDQLAAEGLREQQQDDAPSPDFAHTFSDDDEQDEQEHINTPPEASTMFTAFHIPFAHPSPRYQVSDPLASASPPATPQLPPSISIAQRRQRTRTSSSLSPITEPSLTNSIPLSRRLSTPLSPTHNTTPLSSSPPTTSTSIFTRRLRSHANACPAHRPTIGGRNISEPLSWTLVRSQYSYPKRGLTAEQMSFLSSVESLGRFGVPHSPGGAAIAPSPAYESRTPTMTADYGFPLTGPSSSSSSSTFQQQ